MLWRGRLPFHLVHEKAPAEPSRLEYDPRPTNPDPSICLDDETYHVVLLNLQGTAHLFRQGDAKLGIDAAQILLG
jgi:hypothetical protein